MMRSCFGRPGALFLCLLGWLLCLGGAVAQETPLLSVVEVTPHLVSPTSERIRGEILLRSLEKEEPVRRFALTAAVPFSLRLPAGSIWEISGEIPGFWVRRQTLTVGSQNQPTRVPLPLWPLGSISGVVKIKDRTIALPKQLRVQTLAAPSFLRRPPVPPGALDCPVDENGHWTCSLPAAVFDLAISSEGLTPVYRWAVEVSAGKTSSLGTIELERGSSVAGWVAAEGGAIEEGCIVRLAPLVAAGADLRTSSDLERTAIERPVHRDGFFQLTGLSPGTYILEVRQPGYAPSRISPLQVEPAAETFLRDPLILAHPLDLAFELEPPLDWLGKPWRARVVRDSEARIDPVVFEGLVDPQGRFDVPGQTTGRFHVSVLDSLGNKLYYRQGLNIGHPSEGMQRIEVDLVDVEGIVRLGREPLPSTLWFGGKNAVVSMKIEADKEGRFFGVLPREGFWIVEIEASPGWRSLTRVEVRAGTSGKAKLDVRLPATRVFGRVLDEDGNPVARAQVFADGAGPPQRTQTDDAGGFELRGLQEGSLRLGAEARSRASDPVFTTLLEGHDVGPIDLRLRNKERYNGSVLSSRGPVPGAQVLVSPHPSTGGGAAGTTGTDGSFHVELPSGLRQAVVAVAAPGFPLQVIGPLTPDALRLNIIQEEGTLELIVPVSSDEVVLRNLSFLVFSGAHMVPFGLVQQWATTHGESWATGKSLSLRLPHMAPGEYRFCLTPRLAEVTFTGTLQEAEAACASGQLSPGGTLSLEPSLVES